MVDDEKGVAVATAEMLRNTGYAVTVMTSSQEALLEFLNNGDRFDLVVTDNVMPFMTGMELCRRIKEIRPGMPVVLFSGHLEDGTREVAIQAGVDEFCLKPISITTLSQALHRILTP